MSNILRGLKREKFHLFSNKKGRQNPIGQAELAQKIKRIQYMQAKMDRGVLKALPVTVFFRDPKRKPKESVKSYRRAMRNMKKAKKLYFRMGPDAAVYIDKETLSIVW